MSAEGCGHREWAEPYLEVCQDAEEAQKVLKRLATERWDEITYERVKILEDPATWAYEISAQRSHCTCRSRRRKKS